MSGRSHHDFWWLPSEIEKKAHVDRGDAEVAFYAALIYVRLLARALKHSEKLLSATNDTRWIESAPPAAPLVAATQHQRSGGDELCPEAAGCKISAKDDEK